jgi:CubicO group peptidase (beta-lactamase class C family)
MTAMKNGMLDEFACRVKEKNLRVITAVVRQGGRITARHDFEKERAVNLFSVSKTFVSMAVGIAMGEGRFNLEDKVVDFFPEAPQDRGEYLELMTVRDLLVMGTGHAECPLQKAGWTVGGECELDIPGLFFAEPVVYRPGTRFLYNSSATYMLSRIVSSTTGELLSDYIYDRALKYLGIQKPRWDTTGGYTQGFIGLHMNAAELSEFGQLVFDGGAAGGRQLIPAGYIEEASKKQIDNSDNRMDHPDQRAGYGYQMWRNTWPNSYRMDGAGGKFVLMLPDYGAVITIVSEEWRNMFAILELVWETVMNKL